MQQFCVFTSIPALCYINRSQSQKAFGVLSNAHPKRCSLECRILDLLTHSSVEIYDFMVKKE